MITYNHPKVTYSDLQWPKMTYTPKPQNPVVAYSNKSWVGSEMCGSWLVMYKEGSYFWLLWLMMGSVRPSALAAAGSYSSGESYNDTSSSVRSSLTVACLSLAQSIWKWVDSIGTWCSLDTPYFWAGAHSEERVLRRRSSETDWSLLPRLGRCPRFLLYDTG